MKIYEFESYKAFVKSRIGLMPNKGRGHFKQMAEALSMHTTLISQVFNGDRQLSLEQACDLSSFWGLNELETEMLLTMVQLERAGSYRLREILEKQKEGIAEKANQVTHRLPKKRKVLSEEAKAIFYSNWYYSGIRLASSVSGLHSIDDIADYFNLPKNLVSKVVEFLLENGLCVEEKGKIKMGPSRTHLPADSPLITRHHLNWRVKEIEKSDRVSKEELLFTAPLSISRKDFKKVRKKILNLIEEVSDVVGASKPEQVACLNIGWTKVKS